jgi:hypothetical protein
MPTTSQIVLATIAILSIVAFALLLAPTFVWVRRRMTASSEQDKEAKTEATLDPKAITRELTIPTRAPADDVANP